MCLHRAIAAEHATLTQSMTTLKAKLSGAPVIITTITNHLTLFVLAVDQEYTMRESIETFEKEMNAIKKQLASLKQPYAYMRA